MAISVIFLWMVCVPRKVKKWVKRFESWKEGLKSMKCTKKVIRSSTNFVARSNSHELYCLIVINSHSVDAAWLKITLKRREFFCCTQLYTIPLHNCKAELIFDLSRLPNIWLRMTPPGSKCDKTWFKTSLSIAHGPCGIPLLTGVIKDAFLVVPTVAPSIPVITPS